MRHLKCRGSIRDIFAGTAIHADDATASSIHSVTSQFSEINAFTSAFSSDVSLRLNTSTYSSLANPNQTNSSTGGSLSTHNKKQSARCLWIQCITAFLSHNLIT